MDKPSIKNEPKPAADTDVRHLGNTAGANMVPADAVSKLVADAVAEALKVAIPAAAVGIQSAQTLAASKSREQIAREVERKLRRCPICALPESACGGAFKKDADGKDIVTKDADGNIKYDYTLNHQRVYVGPKDESLFRWFQGFIISGVRFLSDFPGHQVWIPIKSDILTNVNYWEQDQKDLLQKRSAEGMGAGSVGAQGQVLSKGQQRAIGWR